MSPRQPENASEERHFVSPGDLMRQVCPGVTQAVQTGQPLEGDLETARITNLANGQVLTATPLSATALRIVEAGGLVPYARNKLAQRAAAAAAGT
ncbi:MAG: hypothetical protein JWP22_3193 [Ramlibacter sp.]|jgi:hypothetical protein|nr:hypothetical protein [Ramlibacter sp.]MDB5914518.1 hypothetical protein [Ramlibacter sp.]